MKKVTITLLILLSFLFAIKTSAQQQDPVHGVDGYYYYNVKEIQKEGFLSMYTNGNKIAAWKTTNSYVGDYLKIQMGINDINPVATPTVNPTGKYFKIASAFQFKEKTSGVGAFTITKQYPVLAIKIGLPKFDEHTKATPNSDNEFLVEYTWWNPITNVREKVPLNGLGGKQRHARNISQIKNHLGKDSIYIERKVDNNYPAQPNLWGGTQVNDSLAGFISYIDFSSVFDRQDMIDNNITAFKMAIFGPNMTAIADTLQSTPNYSANGDTILSYSFSNQSKTLAQMPTFYLKWVGTFANLQAYTDFVSQNNGDDPRSDNQLQLNTKLYYANKFTQNYKFADANILDPYRAAISTATGVYNSLAPNNDTASVQWKSWDATMLQAMNDLDAAQSVFLGDITMTGSDPYVKVKSASGNYELRLGSTVTVGSYTGQMLAVGGIGTGVGFNLIPYTVVNGQQSFKLLTKEGVAILSKDTLMLVPISKLPSNPTYAQFVFSNRNESADPLYDFKVGSKFYYVSDEGNLSVINALPDVENLEDLVNYLFQVEAVEYDADGDRQPMFNSFEFNTPVSFNPNDQWEQDTLKVDGWQMLRWRMQTRLNQVEVNGLGCLSAKYAPTYYEWNDSTHATPLTTDYSTATGPSFYRGGGKYKNVYDRDPSPRDSSFLININPYKARYFAVKWKANNENIKFGSLTLLVNSALSIVLNEANLKGVKGNVHYWDLMAAGFPYGDTGVSSQFMNFAGFQSATDEVLIDWIRTYNSEETVPTEDFNGDSSVEKLNADAPVQIYSYENRIFVNALAKSDISIYSIDGSLIAKRSVLGTATIDIPVAGVYIIKTVAESKTYSSKLIIK